ncbi:energy transducer TonB [Aquisalinus flavus]|uniref:Protein TonB n=1 Tax=Aquisalinus flavus TaxID=1526572 RepID=A0A8J2V7D1_9PROT|nr:energy transducer TonB [Aquisalinus flavus]MBD0425218.1 energy transducer TonB [Aquisalinus flavus]UNE49121.1 energy transducer TonB [Aquisalinus flavus]GGD17790.1 hypothetical protein GCM10011342_28280 [Aquisalinus flavus]
MSHALNVPRGNNLRLTIGLPIAAVITAALFLVMGGLIKSDDIIIGEPAETPTFSILREKPKPVDPIEPIEKTVTETPPPPPDMTWQRDDTGGPIVDATRPEKTITTVTPGDTGNFNVNAAVLQTQPIYPPRCAGRGVEGSVTVIFDVLANGGVTNARIVRSSDSCFDRSALEAIRQWKYMPASGQSGIIQRGVQKTFVFQLQG